VKILEALRCRKSSPGFTEVGSENPRKVSCGAVVSVVVPAEERTSKAMALYHQSP